MNFMEFEPDLKFKVDDKVVYGITSKQGIVKDIKWSLDYYKGSTMWTEKYNIQFSNGAPKWIEVKHLKPIYEFNKAWEQEFCDLMINSFIGHENYEMAEAYVNKKNGLK